MHTVMRSIDNTTVYNIRVQLSKEIRFKMIPAWGNWWRFTALMKVIDSDTFGAQMLKHWRDNPKIKSCELQAVFDHD